MSAVVTDPARWGGRWWHLAHRLRALRRSRQHSTPGPQPVPVPLCAAMLRARCGALQRGATTPTRAAGWQPWLHPAESSGTGDLGTVRPMRRYRQSTERPRAGSESCLVLASDISPLPSQAGFAGIERGRAHLLLGETPARSCRRQQCQGRCCCPNEHWDGHAGCVLPPLRPVPGEGWGGEAWRRSALPGQVATAPLTLCPSCLCRCAGSLPPRLVLRAGSPVSSAECRVSAASPLPSSCAGVVGWGPPPPPPSAPPAPRSGSPAARGGHPDPVPALPRPLSGWHRRSGHPPCPQEGDISATVRPTAFRNTPGQDGQAGPWLAGLRRAAAGGAAMARCSK